MSLREDIHRAPRGTQARILRVSGLSKPTIINALKGRFCTAGTAQEIAAAVGEPERWAELVVLRTRNRHREASDLDLSA